MPFCRSRNLCAMSVQQVGRSGTSSSSISSLPLNNEAVFRIELSFSSRKSSVIVMRCTARLYSLERVGQGAGPAGQAAAGQGEKRVGLGGRGGGLDYCSIW